MFNCVKQHCTASIFKAGEKKKSCVQVKLQRELPVGRQNIITS